MRPELEPVVAFGARMSWCGLLRAGDEFCSSERSQRVVLTSRTGPPLQRNYGAWSTRYRRFTANLSSPEIVVRPSDGDPGGHGVEAILHWVRRADAVGSGPGTVCAGDAWPADLWRRFTEASDRLLPGGVAEQLAEYEFSTVDGSDPFVRAWRERLHGSPRTGPAGRSSREAGWLPVPARLEVGNGPSRCLVSWSPTSARFATVREALASEEGRAARPDLERQAEYHVECALGALHGVRFGAGDALGDPEYERTPIVARLLGSLRRREEDAIVDPARGRLDRRG